jgi:hypothetical protein
MGVFLWLSDLHLDTLYGTALAARHSGDNPDCSLVDNVNATILEHPYGRVGCDSPLSLVESALHSAVLTSVNYKHSIVETTDIDFVLVTGDFIRHQLGALLDSSSSSGIDIDIDIDPIEYAQTILSTCINSIQTILPGVPVLPVLGNNDVFPDYYLDTNFCSEQELEEDDNDNDNNATSTTNDTDENKNSNVLAMVRNGLKDAFLSEDEASTFANGGYFSRLVELPSSESSILVLSLNTILYSSNHAPDCYYDSSVDEQRSREDDPLGQFAWIESQLRRAAAGGDAATSTSTIVGVYLAGHIPPSIGSYRHSQLWRDQYLERYSSILNDYSSGRYNSNLHHPAGSSTNPNIGSHQLPPPPPILGHFFGHVHTEEFRLLAYGFDDKHNHNHETDAINATDGGANENKTTAANANESESESTTPMVVPLLFASSITPIYGSNPSYRMVQYDDGTGGLLDYHTHYLDLGQWNSSSSSISDTGTGNSTSSSSSNNNTLLSTPAHETPIWTELPGFLEAYGVPDLSTESFESIFANLEEECRTADTKTATTNTNTPSSTTTTTTTNRLWETFWNRQNLYSSAPDNDDDIGDSNMELMIDWLCTMRASSKEDYERCLDVRMNSEHPCGVGSGHDDDASAAASSGSTAVILIAANVATMLGVVVWFWGSIRRKRAKRRTMYLQMSLEKESEEHEIEFNCEYDHGDGKEANLSPNGVKTQTAEHCMPSPEGIDDRQGTILSRELV